MKNSAKDRLTDALNTRGYYPVVYGDKDDPAMDVGVVPAEVAWDCYNEAMPGMVPCLDCFTLGVGVACLAGECVNPLPTQVHPPELPSGQ